MDSARIARACALVMAVSALLLASGAPPALAGEFVVASCQADAPNYATNAFADRATPQMMVKRACDPAAGEVRGINRVRGMITRNQISAERVPRGAYAMLTLSAPPGTHFSAFRWAGLPLRSDCRYSLQLYAERDGTTIGAIKNVRANHDCPQAAHLSQAAGYKPRTYRKQVAGATRIVQRVACVGGDGRDWCSGRAANYITTYQAKATIVDDQPPSAVSIIQDTPLARGEWVAGKSQPLNYDAADNTGVLLARALIGDRESGTDERPCALAAQGAYATPIPCPNGPPRTMIVDTTQRLVEGTQQLVVEAQDTAGVPARSAPVPVRIDNTPPERVDVSVVGGEAWRNSPDFQLAWSNPPEGDRAPITGASYTLCAVVGGTCTRGEQPGDGIAGLSVQAPAPGEFRLTLVRRDAAGNASEQAASVPVTLRYDPEPPQLGFESTPAGDPTTVAVQVSDKVSGLADGTIEISRAGSDTWQTLATQREGNRLLAHIDDAAMQPGDYVLRATARDQAGNLGSTSARLDGQPMALTLPLRVGAQLQAGVARERIVQRTIRRHGKRHRVRRRDTTSSRPGTCAPADGPVAGRLTSADGQAVARRRGPGARTHRPGRRAARGGAAHRRRRPPQLHGTGSASRTLRLLYAGAPSILPARAEIQLHVAAASSLRVSRRAVRNQQAVIFSGRVRTLPLPAAGKLVELQVRLSQRWETFRTTRTDADGTLVDPLSLQARLPRRATVPLPRPPAARSQLPVRPRKLAPRACARHRTPLTIEPRRPQPRSREETDRVLDRIRRHLTYANVMATLAVFIALGGSSYAAYTISGSKIKNRSIRGSKLRHNTLTGARDQGVQARPGAAGARGGLGKRRRARRRADRRAAEDPLPEDTYPLADVCVEKTTRPPSSYGSAALICSHVGKPAGPGRRLPTHLELMAALTAVDLAPGGELTSNVYPSSTRPGELDVLYVTDKVGSTALVPDRAGVGDKAYRCVTDPLN